MVISSSAVADIRAVRVLYFAARAVAVTWPMLHNVYFHKEVTFISNRSKSRKDSHHWVLYRKGNVTSIKSYGQDNPIKGSYELLWKDLRERRDAMDNIEIQNIMRRIIETHPGIEPEFPA